MDLCSVKYDEKAAMLGRWITPIFTSFLLSSPVLGLIAFAMVKNGGRLITPLEQSKPRAWFALLPFFHVMWWLSKYQIGKAEPWGWARKTCGFGFSNLQRPGCFVSMLWKPFHMAKNVVYLQATGQSSSLTAQICL